MTDTFRTLCAELAEALSTNDYYDEKTDEMAYSGLLKRARSELAKPEPEAPTDEELLQLPQWWNNIAYVLDDGRVIYPWQGDKDVRDDVLDFARTILARWGNPATTLSQPKPIKVTDDQLNELDDDYYWFDANHSKPWVPFARTVLDRFGSLAIEFTPASERLPEATDCDTEGRCWWWCPPDWVELRNHESADAAFVAGATHWLPHWAIPLPEGGAA